MPLDATPTMVDDQIRSERGDLLVRRELLAPVGPGCTRRCDLDYHTRLAGRDVELVHEPGAGEAARKYPQTWGGNWPSLAPEGETVLRGRPVAVTLLRLNNDADRTFLSRVFPELVVTDAIGPDALRACSHR